MKSIEWKLFTLSIKIHAPVFNTKYCDYVMKFSFLLIYW